MENFDIEEVVQAWSTQPRRPRVSGSLAYVSLIEKLEAEWTPEKLQTFIVTFLHERCEWALKRRTGIEIENAEKRRQGVSFQERKKHSSEIATLTGLFELWRGRGIFYKKNPVCVADFVKEDDLYAISQMGFESHLKSLLVF